MLVDGEQETFEVAFKNGDIILNYLCTRVEYRLRSCFCLQYWGRVGALVNKLYDVYFFLCVYPVNRDGVVHRDSETASDFAGH